jgi:hypothetical protein
MRDYPGYRLHLAARRLATAGLRAALALVVRVRAARRRRSGSPRPVTGTVVLLDRCLGLGDALMISPALGLLAPLGPVTVVTALPPLLEWDGEWLVCTDWAGMIVATRRLAAAGRRLLVPRLGLAGLLTLLRWPGGVPEGVVRLGPASWLDTTDGRQGPISGHHYTDGALACAQALLDRATIPRATGTSPNRVPAAGQVPRLAPRLPPDRGDAAMATLGLPDHRPLVALAPWATSRVRRWPPGHWSRLIDRLATADGKPVLVLLGSAGERPAGDEIIQGLHRTADGEPMASVVNLMGRLSLDETTALVARAALLVACDNGIMHLGLGVGTPVVAIFGSTDPTARLTGNRWRLAADPSLCPHRRAPCYPDLHRDPSCPTAAECLSGLAPERVAGMALDLLTISEDTRR